MMEGYDMDVNVCTQLQSFLQGLGCSSVTGETRAVPFGNYFI
jgi:hypothetical protein